MAKNQELKEQIPGPEIVPFLKKQWVLMVFADSPPVLISAVGCVSAFAAGQDTLGLGLLVLALWLVVAFGAQVSRTRSDEAKLAAPPVYLTAVMNAARTAALRLAGELDNDGDLLRATIHKVHPQDDDKFLQCIDYVGGNRNGMGRVFPRQCGIIGRAASKRKVLSADMLKESFADCVDELVEVWGYTPEGAKSLDPSRRSWMAVPITGKEGVLGVVYFDSCKSGFFTNSEEIQLAIIGVSEGLAAYLGHNALSDRGSSDGKA